MKLGREYLIYGLLALLLSACQSQAAGPQGQSNWQLRSPDKTGHAYKGLITEPSFRHLQSYFQNHCLSCHGPDKQEADLNLDCDSAYDALIDADSEQAPMKLVEPGEPERSYLLHKLRGSHKSVGGEGQIMPIVNGWGVRGLLDQELEQLRQWIQMGAKKN